jgi:hypothetical protein
MMPALNRHGRIERARRRPRAVRRDRVDRPRHLRRSVGSDRISVDLSDDYCRLARWRTTDPGERARVLGVDKPPVKVDGQFGLFEVMAA